jgi:DNA repair exonuclease SbcCD ATPase subunit/predicted DNA-binding WGR domain protein
VLTNVSCYYWKHCKRYLKSRKFVVVLFDTNTNMADKTGSSAKEFSEPIHLRKTGEDRRQLFYEYQLNGSKLLTRHGKVGRRGLYHIKDHTSQLQAQVECLNRIKLRLDEGYHWIVGNKRRKFPLEKLSHKLEKVKERNVNLLRRDLAEIQKNPPRVRSPRKFTKDFFSQHGLNVPKSQGTFKNINPEEITADLIDLSPTRNPASPARSVSSPSTRTPQRSQNINPMSPPRTEKNRKRNRIVIKGSQELEYSTSEEEEGSPQRKKLRITTASQSRQKGSHWDSSDEEVGSANEHAESGSETGSVIGNVSEIDNGSDLDADSFGFGGFDDDLFDDFGGADAFQSDFDNAHDLTRPSTSTTLINNEIVVERDKLREENGKLLREIKRLEDEVERINSELTDLNMETQLLREDKSALESNFKIERENLQRDIGSLNSEIDTLKLTLSKRDQEVSERVVALEIRIQEFELKKSQDEAALASREQDVIIRSTELDQQQEQLSKEYEALRTKEELLKKQENEEQKRIALVDYRAQELLRRTVELEEREAALITRDAELNAANILYDQRRRQLEQEYKQLEESKEKFLKDQREFEETRIQYKKLYENEMANLNKEKESLHIRENSLQEQAERLRREVTDVNQKEASIRQKEEDLVKRQERARIEFESRDFNLRIRETELATMKIKIDEWQKQKDELLKIQSEEWANIERRSKELDQLESILLTSQDKITTDRTDIQQERELLQKKEEEVQKAIEIREKQIQEEMTKLAYKEIQVQQDIIHLRSQLESDKQAFTIFQNTEKEQIEEQKKQLDIIRRENQERSARWQQYYTSLETYYTKLFQFDEEEQEQEKTLLEAIKIFESSLVKRKQLYDQRKTLSQEKPVVTFL